MNKNIPLSGGFSNRKSFSSLASIAEEIAAAGNGSTGKLNQAQLFITYDDSTIENYKTLDLTSKGNSIGFSADLHSGLGEKLIQAFALTLAGVERIRAGIWHLQIIANCEISGLSQIVTRVYYRTLAGTETEILNWTTPLIPNTSMGTVYNHAAYIAENSLIVHDDSIVVKYFAKTTSGSNIWCGFVNNNYSITNGIPATTNIILPLWFFSLLGNEINSISTKASPIDEDVLLIEDSEENWTKKRIEISSLPSGSGGSAGGDLSGTYPDPTVSQVSKSFKLTGIIYDTLTAQKDDYNPTGLADASTIQITLSGDQTITGISGGVAGRILILQSGYTGSTDKLTLKNNSTDSLDANRIFCPLSSDYVLSDDNCVILQYDGAQDKWIVIATHQAPYGNAANTICVGNDARLSDSRTPSAHLLGSTAHTTDSIANVNAKLTDGDMITTLGGEINALTAKTAPVAADIILMEDSAATFAKKKIALSDLSKAMTPFPEFQFFADQLRTPVSSEWPRYGAAAATVAQDSANNALIIRQFDDTVNEGIGVDILIPSGVTNIILDFYSRAQTAPATAKVVLPGIYVRQVADNAAPGAFSSITALTAIDIPNNAYYQYDTQTIALSTLSLTAGRLTQLLIERTATSGTDTLEGDWNIQLLRIRFS